MESYNGPKVVQNNLFLPFFFYSCFISLWFLQWNCTSMCTARAWKRLCSPSFDTKQLSASYFKQHVTYHTQNLQLALGQTASSLICLPLAVGTKPDNPHSSSQRKLTGRRQSVPLASHGLKFFYNFPLFKGHSGTPLNTVDKALIFNIVSYVAKVKKKSKKK